MAKRYWKNETCVLCVFKVDRVCRRFPPTGLPPRSPNYPYVRVDWDVEDEPKYKPACAEYKEKD